VNAEGVVFIVFIDSILTLFDEYRENEDGLSLDDEVAESETLYTFSLRKIHDYFCTFFFLIPIDNNHNK
jgi:hypothetical protein